MYIEARDSRWVNLTPHLRYCQNLLTLVVVIFVNISAPVDDTESAVDLVMNFMALLVLIELDNQLASIFEVRLEKFSDYLVQNTLKETDSAEERDRKLKDMLEKNLRYKSDRRERFPWVTRFETFSATLLSFLLFFAMVVMSVGTVVLYCLVPPASKSWP